MAPIRVGIIGLSTSAKTSWASSAHLPYLKAATEKYLITALCNTSIASAQNAISAYDLPPTTKAYGDPHDLAKDPEVDLVVCSTRVDLHHSTIRPSIEAGKDVYVEWPLASNTEQARDLADLTRQKGVRSLIGLQCRESPIIAKLKSLLATGKIGKVLSSSVVASGGSRLRDSLPEGLKYFTDKEVGGNLVTIGYGHMIDYIHTAFSAEFSSFTAHLDLQRPHVPITNHKGEVIETVTSNVPDLIKVFGTLASSNTPVDIRYRRGQTFKGSPGFEWLVTGELGEIKISGPGPSLQALDMAYTMEVYNFEQDEVEVVKWEEEGYPNLPVPARNVARLYDLFAKGDQALYPDFDDAVLRHSELDAVFRSSEEDKRGSYV